MVPDLLPKERRLESENSTASVHAMLLVCMRTGWFVSSVFTLAAEQPVTTALRKLQIANDNTMPCRWPVKINFGPIYNSADYSYSVSRECV